MSSDSKKIDILMATYNGEEYIAAQLYSLLAQKHKNWQLYVGDDGSTDNTLEIIKSIMRNDERLTIINFSKSVKSASKNFWRMLPYSKSEYTIFCDQDDIWLESKLSLLLEKTNEWKCKDKPNIVFCDTFVYSQKDFKIVSDTLYPYLYLSFEDFIFHNGGYQGCSTLFNSSMKKKLISYYPIFYLHDEILALTAHSFGEVIYIDKPLMLYRIHDNNVIGVNKISLLSRIKSLINRRSYIILPECLDSKNRFYDYYKDDMDSESKLIFKDYFLFSNVNRIKRVQIILRGKLTRFRFYLFLKTILVKVYPS